jgi:hypothetical protein
VKAQKRGRRPQPQQKPQTRQPHPQQAKPAAPVPGQEAPVEPLQPRRRMFYALLAVVGLWIIFLLVMYLTTVRT